MKIVVCLLAVAFIVTGCFSVQMSSGKGCTWNYQTAKLVFSSKTALDGSWNGTSPGPNYRNIWTIYADGTGMTALTTRAVATNAGAKLPAFSPNGSWITFRAEFPLDGVSSTPITAATNIWVMGSTGSGLTALTRNTLVGRDSYYGYYSPDGTKIAFVSRMSLTGIWDAAAAAVNNLWIMNSDGTGLTNLTAMTTGGITGSNTIDFSPDGTKIVFLSYGALDGSAGGVATSSPNVWTIKVNGTGLTALTRNSNANLNSTSVSTWSPDGTKIVFLSRMPFDGSGNWTQWDGAPVGSENVWVMDANGSNIKALTHNTGAGYGTNYIAVFSPNSTKIAFLSSTALDGTWNGVASGTPNIWVMNVDGTSRTAITQYSGAGYGVAGNMAFTPDSAKIAWISLGALDGSWGGAATASNNIWIANIDGSGMTALTRNSNANLDSFIQWARADQAFYQPKRCN